MPHSQDIADRPATQTPARPSAATPGANWTLRVALLATVALGCVPLALYVPPALTPAALERLDTTAAGIRAQLVAAFRTNPPAPAVPAVAPQPAMAAGPALERPPADQSRIVYGDRLKITFFETMSTAPDSARDIAHAAGPTVFPRMDLSADYVVDAAGVVTVAQLGRFRAAGRSVSSLQDAIAASFQRAEGRPAEVRIALAERPPVYVLGAVRGSGAISFIPGMTVLQLFAAAGGNPVGDTSRTVEAIRETQHLRQAQNRLAGLLVTEARLEAAHSEATTLALSPQLDARLATLVGPAERSMLIKAATTSLLAERAGYQQQRALAERQVGVARTEVAAQASRAAQLDALLAQKATIRRDMADIARHGSVSGFKLAEMDADIGETKSRREDLRVAAAQSARRLVEAEIDLARLQLNRSLGMEHDLATAHEAIADTEQGIAAMRAVVSALHEATPGAVAALDGAPRFEITRRGPDGIDTISATEATELEPGDVVRVHTQTVPEPVSEKQLADLPLARN